MKHIVVDTNYFINHPSELRQLATTNKLITTHSVIGEIHDSKTQQNMDIYFSDLEKLSPEVKYTNTVVNFSKKTGDFISLSSVDMELIGLAVQLIKKAKKGKYLRKEPARPQNITGSKQSKDETLGWGADWASDDESGWVGPSNLHEMNKKTAETATFDKIGVGLMTEDFAMQNIALQLGIPLINIDGKIISKIKSYVLECFSCWEISRQSDLVFCKSCGKNTLLKVTCEFLDNGEFILYRKKNKQIRVRGSRHAIPEPQGGREVKELIMYDDDFLKPKVQSHIRRIGAKKRKEDGQVDQNFEMGLGFEDIAKNNFKYKMVEIGYGRKNPNVNSFWKNRKN